MADKPQKTQLLTDAPPEVQAAIDRQSSQPQQGQSTVLLDAPNAAVVAAASAQQPRQVVVPTMMKERPSGALPPVQAKKQSTAGRWIAGPLIAIVVAGGTAALAGVVMPVKPKVVAPPPKTNGKLMLQTNPAGASVTIDGKPFPHFTPTEVVAEVGSTVRIGLKLDGYAAKDEEVIVASGERPMVFTLEKAVAVPAPVAPVAVAPGKHDHDHDHHHDHDATVKVAKESLGGKGTISVFVRPWAIVYVDGTRLRQTPVQTYELPSGKHVIELVNDPKGKREKMLITLKPGEAQEIKKDWDK